MIDSLLIDASYFFSRNGAGASEISQIASLGEGVKNDPFSLSHFAEPLVK
jgi:hypothetical protein